MGLRAYPRRGNLGLLMLWSPPPGTFIAEGAAFDEVAPFPFLARLITVLRERGKPMSRRELHVALGERGLLVKGSDPIKALGTMLWRGRDRLTQIEGYGYWPKGDTYEPANYHGGL